MGMASRFGLSPTEFGENLKDGYSKIDVRQDPSEPMEAAAEYLGEKITKPEDVMTAAKNLMAAQIAHEPLVRKETRMAFFERATLTVVPTKKVCLLFPLHHQSLFKQMSSQICTQASFLHIFSKLNYSTRKNSRKNSKLGFKLVLKRCFSPLRDLKSSHNSQKIPLFENTPVTMAARFYFIAGPDRD